MSGSNWRQFVKDRGGLVASFSIASLFIVIVVQLARVGQWEIDYDAASNAASYAADAKYDIATECNGLTAQARDDCEDKINDPARANQRDEYDLAAQRTMALWTAIMGGMAVVGVALSGVGVYLIWRTWDATRIAANNSGATFRAYLAKERGYLTLADTKVRWSGNSLAPTSGVSISIKNLGLSPCIIERVQYKYLPLDPRWDPGRGTEISASILVPVDGTRSVPMIELPDITKGFVQGFVDYATLETIKGRVYFAVSLIRHPGDAYEGESFDAEFYWPDAMPRAT